MWVANSGDGTVSEVADGKTVGDPIYVGNGPSGIAVSKGAVWVALSVDGAVAKIDPDTGRVVEHVFGRDKPDASRGRVWQGVGHERVGRDGDADRSGARVRPGTPIAVGRGPNGITIGAGAVWVTNSLDGTVTRIDPQTLSVNDVSMRAPTLRGWPWWEERSGSPLAGRAGSSVSTPPTGRAASPLSVGANPQDVAAVGDGAAITTTTSPKEHRGGTLTIVAAGASGGMVAHDRPPQR